jgi:hypothetical protein
VAIFGILNLIEFRPRLNLQLRTGPPARQTEMQEWNMSLFKRGNVWWYSFFFAGQLVRESSRSTSKTIAKSAEQERRRELEAGYNNVKEVRQNRIRTLAEIIVEYLVG